MGSVAALLLQGCCRAAARAAAGPLQGRCRAAAGLLQAQLLGAHPPGFVAVHGADWCAITDW